MFVFLLLSVVLFTCKISMHMKQCKLFSFFCFWSRMRESVNSICIMHSFLTVIAFVSHLRKSITSKCYIPHYVSSHLSNTGRDDAQYDIWYESVVNLIFFNMLSFSRVPRATMSDSLVWGLKLAYFHVRKY